MKYSQKIPKLSSVPLVNAYLLGHKKKLPRAILKIHRNLNLQHLMTPSGLHLGSILLILSLISKNQIIRFITLIILSLITFPYDGLDSFKRMILFGLIRTYPFHQFSLTMAFSITFITAFLLGQYSDNPLSFCLSFIFLGILLNSKSNIKIFSCLLFTQALISDWFENDFYPIGALYGLGVSLATPLLFPLLFIEGFFDALPFSEIWLSLLRSLDQYKGPSLSFSYFIFTPIILYWGRKKLSLIACLLTILLYHRPLTPLPRQQTFSSPAPKQATKVKKIKDGYLLEFENKMKCYSRLKIDQWSTHCYK